MDLFIKQKQTHRHRKQIYGYQRQKGEKDKLRVWDQQIQTIIYKITGVYYIAQGNIFNIL